MARRLLSRQGGFVHDINTVAALSDEPNNIRLLSDRSLYILQNLSLEEVTFLSRYGTLDGGDFYFPVLAGTPDASEVEGAIDLLRRDLNSMAVEDLLECICRGLSLLGDQGESEGQDIESTPSDGAFSVGQGEQFPDQETYFDAKCRVANAIYDTVLGAVVWLDDNNVDLLAGLFGGVTSGLIVGLLSAGPVGWAVVFAASVLAGLSGYLIRYSLSFADLEDALVDVRDECVLALYNASDTQTAEGEFLTAIENSAISTTPIERGVIAIILTSDVLNQLFEPRDDVASYESASPVDCGSALLQLWSFVASGESWSFRDDSTGGYSASGVWNSGAEAWRITIIGPGSGTGPFAFGTILITGLSIGVPAGGSIQFDHSATGDGIIAGRRIKAIFSDVTEQEFTAPPTATAGTAVMTFAAAKTLAEIEISTVRNWTIPFNTTRDVEEVRVFGI